MDLRAQNNARLPTLPKRSWIRLLVAAAALSVLVAGCGGPDSAKPAGSAAAASSSAPVVAAGAGTGSMSKSSEATASVDQQLADVLKKNGFTGKIQQSLPQRLGRNINTKLAAVGQQLFFDKIVSLRGDNTCAGCHSPTNGFGDSQSISIGILNNLLVGPDRIGPRNQRRAPAVVNTAFYPALMWNGRIASASGDPFDKSKGFIFPPGEAADGDGACKHLLISHAFFPVTELNESAGFRGVRNGVNSRLWIFDDGLGETVPDIDATGFRDEGIRAAMMARINAVPAYVSSFGAIFPTVKSGSPVSMDMFAQAIAEFEFSLTHADAPIDQFARGSKTAMTTGAKRGALLFFGKANCVACHAVSGQSNEMFSDFKNHNIGVPQIAPEFGLGKGDTIFDGPGEDEDYGMAQISGQVEDRYKFRTSPLRNVALQPAFFHNGSFTKLDDAIRHHLDVLTSLRTYNAKTAGVASDLDRLAPIANVAATLDPLLSQPTVLSAQEFSDLVEFVRDGLLDANAKPGKMCALRPATLPSKAKALGFEGCP
jgi:cytochrome c peroxidase